MKMNTAYSVTPAEATARALMRAGLWEAALGLADTAALRAEILTDAFWWRLDGSAGAEAAVAALSAGDPLLGGFYDAQLAYTRVIFGVDPRPGDARRARAGFSAAAGDGRLTYWASFWLGVVAEHLDHVPERAAEHFTRALKSDDPLLESYAIRHLGTQAMENGGLGLLRRSYHLRAALGARPHTAAAAATLAAALPAGTEAEELTEIAARTARELRLTWLADAL
jgi:hypothetical protein